MEAYINLEDLKNVITLHNKVKKAENIKIETDINKIVFTTTNLDITLITEVNTTDNNRPGIAVIPSDKLKRSVAIVDKNTDLVNLNHTGNDSLKVGRSAEINCLQAEEFPLIPKLTVNTTIVDFNQFYNALELTKDCLAPDNSKWEREILTAYHINAKEHSIVATNSYVMAKAGLTFPDIIGSFNVRQDIFPLLKSLKSTKPKALEISNDNQLKYSVFSTGNHTIYVRNVDAEFPNYNDIFPKDQPELVCEINPKGFTKKLNKASKLIKDPRLTSTESAVPLELTLESNQINLLKNDKAEGIRFVDTFTTNSRIVWDEPFKINFNNRFLKVAVENFEDIAEFNLYGSLKPMVVTGDQPVIYLIMPIRVDNDEC